MAYTTSISNPTVEWNGARLREVESIDFNMGCENEVVTPINDNYKPEYYQDGPFTYDGSMTIVTTDGVPEVDWVALNAARTEGDLVVKLAPGRRYRFQKVRIGRISSTDNGRRMTVPFVALDGSYV